MKFSVDEGKLFFFICISCLQKKLVSVGNAKIVLLKLKDEKNVVEREREKKLNFETLVAFVRDTNVHLKTHRCQLHEKVSIFLNNLFDRNFIFLLFIR